MYRSVAVSKRGNVQEGAEEGGQQQEQEEKDDERSDDDDDDELPPLLLPSSGAMPSASACNATTLLTSRDAYPLWCRETGAGRDRVMQTYTGINRGGKSVCAYYESFEYLHPHRGVWL
eukprot:SAG25_NODE_294_length_10260_cov_64.173211_4_plen_118_part_00